MSDDGRGVTPRVMVRTTNPLRLSLRAARRRIDGIRSHQWLCLADCVIAGASGTQSLISSDTDSPLRRNTVAKLQRAGSSRRRIAIHGTGATANTDAHIAITKVGAVVIQGDAEQRMAQVQQAI